jgi:hypothetical protein
MRGRRDLVESIHYDPRKLNKTKIDEFTALAEEIEEKCSDMSEGSARYENAEDLSGEEATDEREIAREETWEAATEIIEEAEKLHAMMKAVT